jgi:manganese-dependent inorganic pyrophosphatase
MHGIASPFRQNELWAAVFALPILNSFCYNMRIMNKKSIYVIGHKCPDTDTVCSAIAYAELLKKVKVNAVAAIPEAINPETKYVLDYFKVKTPAKLKSIKGKQVILVDHNEIAQSPDGIEEAEVVEILDHHKIGRTFSNPISFYSKPVGSTATIVAREMFATEKFKITKQLAGILVSAILSDTIVFKSSTTTSEDIAIAKELGKIAGIKDLKKFGIEIKKKKADIKKMTPEKIIYSDFKLFNENKKAFGIGQIEVVDLKEANEKKEVLLKEMQTILEKEKLAFLILMVTDIINEGSNLLICGDVTHLEKAFGKKAVQSAMYVEKMMSRKKDLLPKLVEVLQK